MFREASPPDAALQRMDRGYGKVGDGSDLSPAPLINAAAPALSSYLAGLDIIKRLARSDPDIAGWQHTLSQSYEKVGDAQAAQGKLPAALISYQEDFAIANRLAKSDSGNARWQRDLAVSYSKLADAYVRTRTRAPAGRHAPC